MPCPSHFSWFEHLNNIQWGAQFMKLLIIESSPLTCYFNHLRPKYPSQHPILEHPQSTFLPQCERPSFTPIQNNRLNMHLKWSRWKWIPNFSWRKKCLVKWTVGIKRGKQEVNFRTELKIRRIKVKVTEPWSCPTVDCSACCVEHSLHYSCH